MKNGENFIQLPAVRPNNEETGVCTSGRSWLGGVLLGLIATGMAPAADENALPAVEINSHYDNAVGTSDAASQGSATAKLIANRPLLRPGEVLEFVPGMIVTQHSGDGKANQYFLRGFNLDHGTDFATWVDGMPLNMRSHAHGQGYTDLNFLIPELVGRIDYRKGPYAAEDGDFSSAGSARLRLVDRLPQGVALFTLGSYGYGRALLANSTVLGDGYLLYGLELGGNRGPWDNPENLRKVNALLRYSSGIAADGYSITGMFYRGKWNATDQIPRRAVDAGQVGRFGAVDNTDGGESSRYSLSFALRQPNAWGFFEANAYAVQSRLDLFSNFTYFQDNATDGDQFNQSERRRTLGLNLAQAFNGKLGNLDMQNRIGLQVRDDRLSPVGLYTTVARQRSGTTREDQVRESSAGLYAENVIQWLPKLRSVAGLRYDSYRFDVQSSIDGNSGRRNAGITSPKLSLILGPWAKTEFFINYGQGFHSNDARGVTQTQLPNGAGPADPAVPLVKTRGAELGLRTELIPGLQSSLAIWQLKLASELVFVGDAGATEASRASRRSGIEWNNHYVATPWLLFDLDVAASRARYTQDDPSGNTIPGALGKVVSAGFTVTDRYRWFGGVQLRYLGPRPLVEDNSVRSAATALTYARIGYRFSAKARLALDIYNLFNRKASDIDYYYASQLRGEPAPVSDIHFHPVEPRSARLTLTLGF
jgi:outer membrane receptor protein involved in Fe transport